ncbi:MAG TPA: hypothetical protein V6D17_14090 [Candidatus Obscuribacterales bacterium]
MTINPEMLKQLLDEFDEKEALTREEINVVEQEIQELEERIIQSKERLALVAEDKEKIRQMMARYTGEASWTGNNAKPTQPAQEPEKDGNAAPPPSPRQSRLGAASSAPAPVASVPASTPPPAPAPAAPSPAAAIGPAVESGAHVQVAAPAPVEAAPAPEPPPPVTPVVPGASRLEKHSQTIEITKPVTQAGRASAEHNIPPAPAAPEVPVTLPQAAPLSASPMAAQPEPMHEEPYQESAPASAPASEEQPAQPQAGAGEEGEDDTVKSINDALRGLFR